MFLDPQKLDKFKRHLKQKRNDGAISITGNRLFDIFMWCALEQDPTKTKVRLGKSACALYLAFESKLTNPTDRNLRINVKIDPDTVFFSNKTKRNSWKLEFNCIHPRDIKYGDLPCESYRSEILFLEEETRQFQINANIHFDKKTYFRPLSLTLSR